MKKYYQSDTLQDLIDWDNIMKMPRHSGGHDEQMIGLFKNAELIGHFNEVDYSGQVATCIRLSDNRYVIYNDYYGSCSGCDSWEGADDKNVTNLCILLANDAYIFKSIYDVIEFLKEDNKHRFSWNNSLSKSLLDEILKNTSVVRDLKINYIIN